LNGGDCGSRAHDLIVNQLSAKMDGVNRLDNNSLIGMTNRKDTLDPALLRLGRFEVEQEIKHRNLDGRLQILNIHTRKMQDSRVIEEVTSTRLLDIAKEADGYSGIDFLHTDSKAAPFVSAYPHLKPYKRIVWLCDRMMFFGKHSTADFKDLHTTRDSIIASFATPTTDSFTINPGNLHKWQPTAYFSGHASC